MFEKSKQQKKKQFEAENPEKIRTFPAMIYLLKVNNKNTRARCVICSKLTITSF